MSETADFRFSPDAIGHVLLDRVVEVPVYQRSYSWEQSEIEEFWEDLLRAFRNEQSEYFIGNLVLSEEGAAGSGYAIIDGQQRLATTVIILAAVRNTYAKRDDDELAESIQREFIATFDRRSRETNPRIKLNSDDGPFFQRLVVEQENAEELDPLQSSHELILQAYQFFCEKIEGLADDAGEEWSERLNDWTDFLEAKVRVVIVDVPTEADAFLIFETLNDRGADLTIADLLKNYLFRRAGEDLNPVRDAWMSALGALEMSAQDAVFTTFIRHLWSSKYGATRERELYKSIKERITNRPHAVEFSQEMRATSRLYAALLNSSHDYWSDLGHKTRENIETLERLRLEQMRPLLLTLMRHFDPADLRHALRSLVSWGVRGLIVGGIGGGKTERAYCQAAIKVRSGDVKSVPELLEALASIVPSDDEFRTYFEKTRVTTGRLARYYLHVLERTVMDEDEPELIPNKDAEEVNLEHILPKSPAPGEWSQFAEDEHKIFVHRLGNMALLQKGPNDRLGNKPWADKKPVLGESDLILTKEASGYNDWNDEVITERQKRLAALAVTAWPRETDE